MNKLLKNIHWLIIIGAIFNIVTYYFEVEEKQKDLASQQEVVRSDLEQASRLKKEIANFYKDIDEVKGRIERVALEIEKTQQLLPSEISDSENVGLLRKMADDVNIKEISIMPDTEEDRGFYFARKYKFRAKATYLQFLIMFEKISENKRILNISEVLFKKLDQPQRGKFQLITGEITLESYRFNPNYKEDRGFSNIEKEFVAQPVTSKRPTRGRKPVKEEE